LIKNDDELADELAKTVAGGQATLKRNADIIANLSIQFANFLGRSCFSPTAPAAKRFLFPKIS